MYSIQVVGRCPSGPNRGKWLAVESMIHMDFVTNADIKWGAPTFTIEDEDMNQYRSFAERAWKLTKQFYGLDLKFKGVIAIGDTSELKPEGEMEGKLGIVLYAEPVSEKLPKTFNQNIN